MNKNPKIAIVHDYLNTYGGAESVVNAIWQIYPYAPIYTSLYDKNAFRGTGAFEGANIIYPKWADLPFFNKFYKFFTFTYPLVFENFDLREFDIVISSSANFAKGVLTNQNQLHISYIHTPPRFLYGYKTETSKRDYWYWNIILKPLDSYLRVWDFAAAQRPDFLVCNSLEVKERIKRFYARDATVIYPFAAIPAKQFATKKETGEKFFLVVSRMSRFKNVDLVIRTASRENINVKIAGTGKEFNDYKNLIESLKNNHVSKIELLGFVSEEKKVDLYKQCVGVINAVEDEDLGMVPLEAMTFGKPVIALKSGGHKETVIDGKTGVFFNEPTEDFLAQAIKRFATIKFNEKYIKDYAKRFSKERFQKEFKSFVDTKYKEFLKYNS